MGHTELEQRNKYNYFIEQRNKRNKEGIKFLKGEKYNLTYASLI